MPDKGEDVFFYVHTNVREDAITLFGFLEEQEKELFLILKTVSGIGPKLALAMLSGLRVGDICQAISGGDIKRLTTLPGVGKRRRSGFVLISKTRSPIWSSGAAVRPGRQYCGIAAAAGSAAADAISALVNLGYPDGVARGALGKVKKQLGEEVFSTAEGRSSYPGGS